MSDTYRMILALMNRASEQLRAGLRAELRLRSMMARPIEPYTPPPCSICNLVHGPEIEHVCE